MKQIKVQTDTKKLLERMAKNIAKAQKDKKK